MGFVWTSQNMDWFERAAENTLFYKMVVNQLKDLIDDSAAVFDLGCGMGFLSLEWAKWVSHVTAVDWNENTIRYLKSKSAERSIPHLSAIHTDWRTWEPANQAEMVCLCYCGGFAEHFVKLLTLTNRLLVVILPTDRGEKHRNQETVERAASFLQSENIPYDFFPISCEFGQPLHSWEEAREFIKYYAGNWLQTNQDQEDFLAQHLLTMVNGYYLPKKRQCGLLLVDKRNCPVYL